MHTRFIAMVTSHTACAGLSTKGNLVYALARRIWRIALARPSRSRETGFANHLMIHQRNGAKTSSKDLEQALVKCRRVASTDETLRVFLQETRGMLRLEELLLH